MGQSRQVMRRKKKTGRKTFGRSSTYLSPLEGLSAQPLWIQFKDESTRDKSAGHKVYVESMPVVEVRHETYDDTLKPRTPVWG